MMPPLSCDEANLAKIINAPEHHLRTAIKALCAHDHKLCGQIAGNLDFVAKKEGQNAIKRKIWSHEAAPSSGRQEKPVAHILFCETNMGSRIFLFRTSPT
jgi:hypothetical protein